MRKGGGAVEKKENTAKISQILTKDKKRRKRDRE